MPRRFQAQVRLAFVYDLFTITCTDWLPLVQGQTLVGNSQLSPP